MVIPLTIEAILNEWGDIINNNEAHELLKSKCNTTAKMNETTGEVLEFALSTANLTTVEFEMYAEKCRRFLKEWFNVEVPLPNEQIELL